METPPKNKYQSNWEYNNVAYIGSHYVKSNVKKQMRLKHISSKEAAVLSNALRMNIYTSIVLHKILSTYIEMFNCLILVDQYTCQTNQK